MKKNIFALTLIACFFAAQLFAQIEVNSTGVGIGTANPQYLLDVNGDIHIVGNILLGANSQITSLNNRAIFFKVDTILAGSTGNSANSNVSFGYQAINEQEGNYNVAIGAQALASNVLDHNTAVGSHALNANIIGKENTAVGSYALNANTLGSYNTAIGRQALISNTHGLNNTAVGVCALLSNTTGNIMLPKIQATSKSPTLETGATSNPQKSPNRYIK